MGRVEIAEKRYRAVTSRSIASKHKPYLDYIARAYQRKCAICGWRALDDVIDNRGMIQLLRGCEIHHIVPVAEGGQDETDNLVLLCPNHHRQANIGQLDRDTLRAFAKRSRLTDEQIEQERARERMEAETERISAETMRILEGKDAE